jgi:hypothetical protein
MTRIAKDQLSNSTMLGVVFYSILCVGSFLSLAGEETVRYLFHSWEREIIFFITL